MTEDDVFAASLSEFERNREGAGKNFVDSIAKDELANSKFVQYSRGRMGNTLIEGIYETLVDGLSERGRLSVVYQSFSPSSETWSLYSGEAGLVTAAKGTWSENASKSNPSPMIGRLVMFKTSNIKLSGFLKDRAISFYRWAPGFVGPGFVENELLKKHLSPYLNRRTRNSAQLQFRF